MFRSAGSAKVLPNQPLIPCHSGRTVLVAAWAPKPDDATH